VPAAAARLWAGSAGGHLGEALARATGLPLVEAATPVFPDGEVCAAVPPGAAGETVVIVQGTHRPQDRHLQELYQLVDVARHLGAERTICVVPYLAYGRQDRRPAPGQPLSCAIVLRTLAMLGVERLVTIDPHSRSQLADAPLPVTALLAERLLAGWVAAQALRRPLLVSPDAGRRAYVERVGAACGLPALCLDKRRDGVGTISYAGLDGQANGRDVVVLDDLCTSGSTAVPLGRLLLDRGAHSLTLLVTHLLADAEDLRRRIGGPVCVVATDTVPGPSSRIAVAPLLAGWLRGAVG
jgi:ribose-phosphate pyrophosphokinase